MLARGTPRAAEIVKGKGTDEEEEFGHFPEGHSATTTGL